VVVPKARATEVSEAAIERLAREEETRRRLQAGELGLDFYRLRERLQNLGVRWVDSPDDA
jgi:4-hydroxy-4-methyl-2-oxoglutarate aldolase